MPENRPLKSGVQYATTAGVHVGSHEHTHFEFKVGRPRDPQPAGGAAEGPTSIVTPIDFDDESALAQARPEVLHLDPWIVFWQTFEDRQAARGAIRAAIKPLAPARTGEPVTFSGEGSRSGPNGNRLEYCWTFGDGGSARGPTGAHVFARPGVYPVTLVVGDGTRRATTTQHITVCGDPVPEPVLALTAPDEPSFRLRRVCATDVYGDPVRLIPHTLEFVARRTRPVPETKRICLQNLGAGDLAAGQCSAIEYGKGRDWLKITHHGEKNRQSFEVVVDAGGLGPGAYSARVQISCPGVLNSPQGFRVELQVMGDPPKREVTVDDRDPGFYATPHFWVGHCFCRCLPARGGHGGFYLTNGGRPAAGEFARFTPDVQAGRYEVALSLQTPVVAGAEYDVRVRFAKGERIVRVKPDDSRVIGTFEFAEGTDGFVEILAEGSKGLVVADAVTFRHKERQVFSWKRTDCSGEVSRSWSSWW